MPDDSIDPRPHLTYTEIGATEGVLPRGYHHARETRVVGHGRAAFETAGDLLLSWRMHAGAGVRKISGPVTAEVGRDVAFRWLLLRFECRIVSVLLDDDRRGFTYGTLPRHPVRGEEQFLVEIDPATEVVTATITAFSRPSNAVIRLAGPLARLVQAHMTRRYLRAFG